MNQMDLQTQLNRIEFKLDAVLSYFRIPLEPTSLLLQACEARSPSGKLVKLKAGTVINKIQNVSPELGWANVVVGNELLSVPLAFIDIHQKKTQQYQQLFVLENNPQLLNQIYTQQNGAINQQISQRITNAQTLGNSQYQFPTNQLSSFQQLAPSQQLAMYQPQGNQYQMIPQQTTQQPQQQWLPQNQFQQQFLQQPVSSQQMQQKQPLPQYAYAQSEAAQQPQQFSQDNQSQQYIHSPQQLDENYDKFVNQLSPHKVKFQEQNLALSEADEADKNAQQIQQQIQNSKLPRSFSSGKKSVLRQTFSLIRTDCVPPSKREVYVDEKHLNWVKPGQKSGSSIKLSEVTDVRIINGELTVKATKGREMRLKGEDQEMQELAALIMGR